MQHFLMEQFSGLNSESLRSVNELIVLNLIRRRQGISRAGIARSTGLKESTISSIARTLLDEGLIYEAETVDSSGGRRPQNLRINSNRCACLGIDVGVQETTLAVSNFTGELLHTISFPTNPAPDRFLEQLNSQLDSLLRLHIPPELPVEGCGVSVPGLLDRATGRILYSANLEWRDVPVGDTVRRLVPGDVLTEDNVRATGLAEIWFGSFEDPGHRHLVSLVVNEGIGAAIIIGGQLYRGSSLGAGQVGHVSLHPEGPLCRCGNRGCWEAYASDRATLARYQGPDPAPVTMRELVDRALAGEAASLQALDETAGYLGMGLALLVNSLNPEAIILDGEISRAWAQIEPRVLGELNARALAPNLAQLKVRPTAIAGNTSLMGALSLVISRRFVLARNGRASGAA
jgi:predicted NBD/HSP70 family sugar kinase